MPPLVSLVSSFAHQPGSPEEIRAAVPKYVAKILANLRSGEIVLFKDSGWGKAEMGGTLSVQDLADPRARAAVAKMALELARKELNKSGSPLDLPRSITPPLKRPSPERSALAPAPQCPTAQSSPNPFKSKLAPSPPVSPGRTPSSTLPVSKPTKLLHDGSSKSFDSTQKARKGASHLISNTSPSNSRSPPHSKSPRDLFLLSSSTNSPRLPPSAPNTRPTSPQGSPSHPCSSPSGPSALPSSRHSSSSTSPSPRRTRSGSTPLPSSHCPTSLHPSTSTRTSLRVVPESLDTQAVDELNVFSVPPLDPGASDSQPLKRLPTQQTTLNQTPSSKPQLSQRNSTTADSRRSAREISSDNKASKAEGQQGLTLALTPMVISLPYITLHIKNKPVRFLCDTGSMLNLMSPSVRERLDLKMKISPGTVMGVTGASTCEGVCEGEDGKGVIMESVQHMATCKARFVVGPTGQSDCILGMPFFVENRAEIRYVPGKGTLLSFQGQKTASKSTSARKKSASNQRVTVVATDEWQIRKGYEWPAQATQAHLSVNGVAVPVERRILTPAYPSVPCPNAPPSSYICPIPSVPSRRAYSISRQPIFTESSNSLYTPLGYDHSAASCPTYFKDEVSAARSSMSWKTLTRLGARSFHPGR